MADKKTAILDKGVIIGYFPTQAELDRIENDFTYHPPKAGQAPRYEAIRNAGATLAKVLVELCPESRELSVALTELSLVISAANMAIARNE